jgi:putrescine aminotransferase
MMEFMHADVPIVKALGCFFWDANGRRYLDFMSGFSALSLGHNHPKVQEALRRVADMPVIVEGLNHIAAALAHNLALLAPGGLDRVSFNNSGAESVDASLKLARAATGRTKVVFCDGAFHGRTMAALSVNGNPAYRDHFGPMLPGAVQVEYGSLESLERALRNRDVAGFIVEPIQGEGGMIVPPEGYLRGARDLCSRYGALLIADEIQTGLGRTGRMFAVEYEGVDPDILLVGKTLGGGIMPLSAIMTTNTIFERAHGATPRTPLSNSTFGGNARACAAGLAALEILTTEHLPGKAAESGVYLMDRLQELRRRHPAIAAVRGKGLMIGIEFAPVTKGLGTVLSAGVMNKLSDTYMSSLVTVELFQQHQIMTAYTLNKLSVLRLQPALDIAREHIDYVVESLDCALSRLGRFPQAAAISLWNALHPHKEEPETSKSVVMTACSGAEGE